MENKNDLEVEIKVGQDFIAVQESIRHDDTEKALRLTNASAMKTSMYTAKFAAEATTEWTKILNEKQVELANTWEWILESRVDVDFIYFTDDME